MNGEGFPFKSRNVDGKSSLKLIVNSSEFGLMVGGTLVDEWGVFIRVGMVMEKAR
jgi:hypothetical protein